MSITGAMIYTAFIVVHFVMCLTGRLFIGTKNLFTRSFKGSLVD